MNGLGSILGRGLLVLALSGFAVACGDDDGGDDMNVDAGAGSGGNGGNGGNGGDRAGSGGGGSGGTDAGPDITPEQCEEMAVQAPGPECLACVCEIGPEETVACDEACWALVECVGSKCPDQELACITTECVDFLDGAATAMPFGPIVRQCTDVCRPEGDAGVADAGN